MPDNDTETRRIGLGMAMLAWALGLALAWYYFDRYLDHRENPNQALRTINGEEGAEVHLQRNRAGHYVLNGRINGHPVLLLVDTGATFVSVPYNPGVNMGLVPGAHSYANTANGIVETRSTIIDTLGIGPFILSGVRAQLNKGMQGREVLLGMSALEHFEMVQRNRELILRPTN